ncbi:hypothetical protein HaLaN_15830, partial [Haematococcus lacustris]
WRGESGDARLHMQEPYAPCLACHSAPGAPHSAAANETRGLPRLVRLHCAVRLLRWGTHATVTLRPPRCRTIAANAHAPMQATKDDRLEGAAVGMSLRVRLQDIVTCSSQLSRLDLADQLQHVVDELRRNELGQVPVVPKELSSPQAQSRTCAMTQAVPAACSNNGTTDLPVAAYPACQLTSTAPLSSPSEQPVAKKRKK